MCRAWHKQKSAGCELFAFVLVLLLITRTASSQQHTTVPTYDLSSDWSNSINSNGPWTYRVGTTILPLVSNMNCGNSGIQCWPSSCNQPSWATSNNTGEGGFLPAWLKANTCTAAAENFHIPNTSRQNVWFGDVIVHTNDNGNGDESKGPANVLFTLPGSATQGTYLISGALWDARVDRHPESNGEIRPQDWTLLVNGVPVKSGRLSGILPRSQAEPFCVTQTLNVGDRVELQIIRDAAAQWGDFVGVEMKIAQTPARPQANDVVVYFGSGSGIIHVARVAEGGVSDDGTVTKVISKWGHWGVYGHDPDDTLHYGKDWAVYHTIRGSNDLRELPGGQYETDRHNHISLVNPDDSKLTEDEVQKTIDYSCPGLFERIDKYDKEYPAPDWPTFDCRGFVFTGAKKRINQFGDWDMIGVADQTIEILHDNCYVSVPAKHTGRHTCSLIISAR